MCEYKTPYLGALHNCSNCVNVVQISLCELYVNKVCIKCQCCSHELRADSYIPRQQERFCGALGLKTYFTQKRSFTIKLKK